MKKIIIATVVALALLGSCAFQTGGGDDKGSVSMKFSLATGKGGETTPTSARIWIYSDNTLIANTASAAYYGVDLVSGAGSVTINELPPGNAYRLVVAAGTASGDGTYFTTQKYGMSDNFPIKAGVETSVAMTLSEISTAYSAAEGMKSVVVTGGAIVAASSSAVYSGSSISGLTSTAWSASNGTINSLSLGYTSSSSTYFPMANTTNGVYTLSEGSATLKGGAISPVYKDGTIIDGNGALQSGSYDDVFFFQGERQFGGLTGSDTSWTTIKLDFEGLSGKPIMDFFVVGDPASETSDIFGFFATKFVGSFRMGESFIDSENPPEVSDILDRDNSLLSFFGDDIPLIQCFGFTGDAANTLYLGTKNGAYATTASFAAGGNGLGTTPVIVDGTKGINITKMVTRLFNSETTNNVPAVAMLSSSELIIVKGSSVYRMPYVTGLVGSLTDISWNGTKVVMTGSLGVGEIETKTLLPADKIVE